MGYFRLIPYFLIPSYRRKIERKAGWNLLAGAVEHIILNPICDRNDIAAGRIITAKMRELV